MNLYLNMSVCSLVSPEWRCLHLNPSPTSGRPTERGVALREVEPHTERQVHDLIVTYFVFGVLIKNNTIQHPLIIHS